MGTIIGFVVLEIFLSDKGIFIFAIAMAMVKINRVIIVLFLMIFSMQSYYKKVKCGKI